MATYHGGDKVDPAQMTLQQHVTSSASGICVACLNPGPCVEFEQAARVFWLSLRLPRRTPGATRPKLINARLAGDRGLLANRSHSRMTQVPWRTPSGLAACESVLTMRDER